MAAEVQMPNKNIRRGPSTGGAPPDFTNRPTSNDVYVDGSTGCLYVGTSTSGTAKKAVQTGADAPIALTANTTLTVSAHAGVPLVVNAAAGATLTLPAASGSGAKFSVFIGTLITSGSFIVQVANASDYMRGFAWVKSDDTASSSIGWITANTGTVGTESDTLTWNRGTTGACIVGDYVEFVDFATNVWSVETANNATGTEATPFSAAV
jgi:hypothetical protein